MGQSIKVSAAAPVVILPFHKDVVAKCEAGRKARERMSRDLAQLLATRYGAAVETETQDEATGETIKVLSGGPSYEQYMADRKAILQVAKTKGESSADYVRKEFANAVKAVYGKLPESQSPEALRKAAERKIADEAVKAHRAQQEATKAGAPAGQTQDRQPSEAEQIEAIVTRIGLMRTFEACVNILEADDKTKASAVHLRKMLAKVAKELA